MGIGYQGKTLKQMLDENRKLYAETGHYMGLKELRLGEEDPIKLTRFHARLCGACVAAGDAAKPVAGSPTMRAFGECIWMLSAPTGDVLAASLGLCGHIGAIVYFIRDIIEGVNAEEKGGIKEGDIWFNNDCRYGSGHPADCYNSVPIFYKGELIGWSTGMNDIIEIGAHVPGKIAPTSPSVFHDGLVFPPMRIGENFKIAPWWERIWMLTTRAGAINVLDDKSRTTGAIILQEKILEIVEEFGIDYYRQAISEIVERERRTIQRTIENEMVPGIYANSLAYGIYHKGLHPLNPEGNQDWFTHNAIELKITPDKKFFFDWEGTSSEAWNAVNCWAPGVWIGLSWWYIPLILRDVASMNTAIMYLTDQNLPLGSHVNPGNPFVGQSQSAAAGSGSIIATLGHLVTSNTRFMRGMLEEVAPSTASSYGAQCGGIFNSGVMWAGPDFSFVGVNNIGGRPFMDGVPWCGCNINPESDSQETEEWEVYMPPRIVIAKGSVKDTCAHGKYRGAPNNYMLSLWYQVGITSVHSDGETGGTKNPASFCGLSGGYPAATGYSIRFNKTNMMELIEKGEGYPSTLQEIWQWIDESKLKVENITIGSLATGPCENGDLIFTNYNPSPSWGDPWEREPSRVESDLNMDYVSPEVAKNIYGVVAIKSNGKYMVDNAATSKAKQDIIKLRKEKGIPFKQWWQHEREKVKAKEFHPFVLSFHQDSLKWNKSRLKFVNFWQLGEDYKL